LYAETTLNLTKKETFAAITEVTPDPGGRSYPVNRMGLQSCRKKTREALGAPSTLLISTIFAFLVCALSAFAELPALLVTILILASGASSWLPTTPLLP